MSPSKKHNLKARETLEKRLCILVWQMYEWKNDNVYLDSQCFFVVQQFNNNL